MYRVAREKFGQQDSQEKAEWIQEEILRRTERRRMRDARKGGSHLNLMSSLNYPKQQLAYHLHNCYSSSTTTTSPTGEGRFDLNRSLDPMMAWLPFDVAGKSKRSTLAKKAPQNITINPHPVNGGAERFLGKQKTSHFYLVFCVFF